MARIAAHEPTKTAAPIAIHRIWCRSTGPARRERTTSDAIEQIPQTPIATMPMRARVDKASFAIGLFGTFGSKRNPTQVTRIAAVAALETHRHRGEGRCPSGRRNGRWVAINPKGGTQPHASAQVVQWSSGVGGPTPRLHIAPIASISQPHAFRGCFRATIRPTTENDAAGGRSRNCPTTTSAE